MNPKLIAIAEKLRLRFIESIATSNQFHIFLCGGSNSEETKLRRELGKEITQISSKYAYFVYYPEDMFIELILGHQKENLLSLENLLAESVHCVTILVQSPGTFTELGAFTNYRKLQNKLLIIIDPKYKHSRSFISRGPVRYLQTRTKSQVIYSKLNFSNIPVLTRQIAEAIRNIAKHSYPTFDLSNSIAAYRLILALIYVFDPIGKNLILEVLTSMGANPQFINVIAEITINSLINEKKVTFSSDNLSITDKGVYDITSDSTKKRSRNTIKALSDLRLEALNITLRKGYSKVWAGAIGA